MKTIIGENYYAGILDDLIINQDDNDVFEKLEVFFNDDVEGANTPFLGKSLSSGGGYSERTKDIFDKEVYHLIEDAYETSKTVLRENKDVMINMVDKLMEKEILIPGDF